MKNSKKKIVGISVATLIAAAAIAAPAIYFGQNANEKETNPIQHNDERIINVKDNETSKLADNKEQSNNLVLTKHNVSIKSHQPVKYVAIGDQLTAGHLDQAQFDLRGKLDNNQVQGVSFPAFLANYINTVQPARVSSFTNLGISNSSISDWLYLLNEADETYFKNKDYLFFEKVKQNDKEIANPYQNWLSSYFGNFGYSSLKQKLKNNKEVDQSQFTNFIHQLTQANLLTITIGLNDFLAVIDQQLLSQIINSQPNVDSQLLIQFEKNIDQAKRFVANNLKKLLKKLKEINPDLSINVIGYPLPFLRLNSVINDSTKQGEKNVFELITNGLNSVLKDTAKSVNVNFVATNDTDDWLKNNDVFAKDIFNLHPTHLGYKKMAQDVFLKLALGEQYAQNKTSELAQELVSSWDANYFNQDKDSFNQQIAFKNITNPELIIKVVGTENAALLFTQSLLEKDVENKGLLNNANKAKALYTWLRKDSKQIGLLVDLIVNLTSKTETDKAYKRAMFEALFNLVLSTNKTRYLDDAVSSIQNDFDSNDYDKNDKPGTQTINKQDFRTVFNKHLLNDQSLFNLIYDVVYHGNENDLETNKKTLAKFISSFINPSLIIEGLVSSSKNSLESEELNLLKTKLIDILTNTKALDKIINLVVDEIFTNKDNHFKYKTISALISSVVSSKATQIEKEIDSLINTVTKDDKNLDVVYKLFLSSTSSSNNNVFNNEEVKTIVKKLLMKGTALPLLKNYKNDIMKQLKLPATYFGLLDLNQSHLSKQLADVFKPATKSFFDSMIKMFLNKDIESAELEKLTEVSLQNAFDIKLKAVGSFGVVETFTKANQFNYFDAVKGMLSALDENKLDDSQKTQIKDVLKKVIGKVANSSFANKVFSTLEDYAKNKLGDLLIDAKLPFVKNNGKQVWDVISDLAARLIRPDKLQSILELALVDFVDNPDKYANVTNPGELLQVLLTNKNAEVKKLIDTFVETLTKDEKLNKLLSELATQYVLSSLPFKKPATEEQKKQFDSFVNKLIPKISNLTLYKNLQADLLTSLQNHIPLLFSNDPNAFTNKFKTDLVNSATASLLTLLELVEDPNIKEFELISITNLFLDNLDFKKIFKTDQLKPEATALVQNNNQSEELKKAVNTQYESAKASDQTTPNLLFRLFKNLISLSTFNREDASVLKTNQDSAIKVLNNLVEKIFTNSDLLFGIKNTVNGALSNSLLINKLGLSNQQQVELVDAVFNEFLLPAKNEKVRKLIQSFTSTLISNAKELNKKDSMGAVLAFVFEKNKDQIIPLINELTDFVLKDKNVRQVLLGLLVKAVNPNMDWVDLKEESKEKISTFANAIFDKLSTSRFVQTFKSNFNRLITDANIVENILNTKDYAKAFEVLTSDGSVVKDLFNFLAEDQFKVRDYVDVLQIFVFEVLMNQTKPVSYLEAKLDSVSVQNPSAKVVNSNPSDTVFKIVQSLLKTGLADAKSKEKLKEVVETFVSEVFTNKEHGNTLTKWISNLLKAQLSTFNNQVNLIQTTEDLIQQILNNTSVKDAAVDLVKVLISDVLDNTTEYAKADSFAALFETYAQRNADKIKEKLLALFDAIFKDKEITDVVGKGLVTWFEQQFKTTLNEDQKLKVQSFVSTLLQKITDLDVYKKLVDSTFDFIKSNAKSLFEQNNVQADSFLTKLKDHFLSKPEQLINVIEIFKISELSTKDFTDVIDILFDPAVNSLDFSSLIKTDDQKQKESTIVVSSTKSTTTSNPLDFFKQIIVGFINNDLVAEEQVKTKIDTIVNHLLNKVFTSSKLQDEFANVLAAIISKATNLPTTKEDYVSLFRSITTNTTFASEVKNWVSLLIKDISNAKDKYRNLADNQAIINEFTKSNLSTLKDSFIKVLTALVNDPNVQSNFAKAVVSTLENYIAVNLQSSEKEVVSKLLVKLIQHLPNLEFTKYSLEQLIEFTTNAINGSVDGSKLIDQLFNPSSVASLLELFNFNDITADELKVFIDIVIKYLPKIATKAQDNAKLQDSTSEVSSAQNSQKTTVKNNTLETVFNYIHALQTSEFLAKGHDVASKLYGLVEHLIDQVFASNDLKTFITKNLLSLSSNIDLSKLSSTNQNVINNLVAILYESTDFKTIIKTLAKKVILEADKFKENKSFSEFVSTLFNLVKDELKPQLVNLVQNIATSEKTQNVITDSLFDLISSKAPNEIEEKSKSAVKNLVSKILGNAKELPVVKEVIEQLVDKLGSSDFVGSLLGDQKSKQDTENRTAAINNLFDFNDPKKLVSIVDILKNEKITNDDYVNGILAIVNELDFNKFINLKAKSNDTPAYRSVSEQADNSNNVKLNFGFEVAKAFITTPKETIVNDRIVSIGTRLFDEIFDTNKTEGFAQNVMNNLADHLAVTIANNVPELRVLKSQYQESFRKLFTDPSLFNFAKNLLNKTISSVVKDANSYKDINNFADLLKVYLSNNKQTVKSEINQFLTSALKKDGSFVNELANIAEQTVINYFNLSNLSETDKTKIKALVKEVAPLLPSLDFFKEIPGKLLDFMEENTEALLLNPQQFVA
ncbi:SGNH/GDSL hydrolase family protein, partial [Ureaplasma diversum]|uniref:SGNH/GDSL hydrolase family protein n=1 Tax=Ureaplasma diversum TaxID=42094 RepID=UPI00056FF578